MSRQEHDIVMEELESHLTGGAPPAFYAHLEACSECEALVRSMSDLSACFGGLKADPSLVPEPRPGFYRRVTSQIVERQRKEAWGLFSPGAEFFRRVAFASLLTLAALGGVLLSRDLSDHGSDAAAIIAQHDPTAVHSETSDRDRLLVTLANYRQ